MKADLSVEFCNSTILRKPSSTLPTPRMGISSNCVIQTDRLDRIEGLRASRATALKRVAYKSEFSPVHLLMDRYVKTICRHIVGIGSLRAG